MKTGIVAAKERWGIASVHVAGPEDEPATPVPSEDMWAAFVGGASLDDLRVMAEEDGVPFVSVLERAIREDLDERPPPDERAPQEHGPEGVVSAIERMKLAVATLRAAVARLP